MPSTTIPQEAQKLHSVSDRLDSLADEHGEHPVVSEALITISENVRQTATLLDVVGRDEIGLALRIRSSECLIGSRLKALTSCVCWVLIDCVEQCLQLEASSRFARKVYRAEPRSKATCEPYVMSDDLALVPHSHRSQPQSHAISK